MSTRTMKLRRLAALSAMMIAAASVAFAAPASAADQNLQVSMSFDPTPIEPGGTSTFELTVTNPNDDPFPASGDLWSTGVQMQVPALDFNNTLSDDCGQSASGIWYFPGQSTQHFTFHGSQLAGHASCTLSITLTADTAGTYTVSPSDFSSMVGVDAPADAATLIVADALPVPLVDANVVGGLGVLGLLGVGGVILLRRKHLAGS